ncbi:MAG TPA: methyltransferase [Phycisphaerae bacterium]|mgnify:CR=1 FL=1|nr:methyltransferase domain-containing protein [Phycisphaerales bacterium]HRX85688.1 methyltransferase [Phycisphaerae bacterium]
MPHPWTADEILAIARSYQPACVLIAAADLDLFDELASGPLTADEAARRVHADLRGTTTLLDALAALELLEKRDSHYHLDAAAADLLTADHPRTVLAMVQHQGNCLRRWGRLAEAVRDGAPLERQPSIRGADADEASFISAMHNLSVRFADELVGELQPLPFNHLLDIGGASGTWTMAFLRTQPDATATLFDLPHVLPMAEQRLADAGLRDRVQLAGGDFLTNPLPAGADLAWVSAIVHQNSRAQNRRMFTAIAAALQPGGHILLRDIVMEESRTAPVAGALFAINMLVATEAGGTFTFAELRDDLASAGFTDAAVVRHDEGMNSVVRARKR